MLQMKTSCVSQILNSEDFFAKEDEYRIFQGRH